MIWRTILKLTGILSLIVSAYWLTKDFDLEPLLIFIDGILAIIASRPRYNTIAGKSPRFITLLLAFLALILSVIWISLSSNSPFEPVLVLIATFSFIISYFMSDEPLDFSGAKQRQKSLLAKIEQYWIDGKLLPSMDNISSEITVRVNLRKADSSTTSLTINDNSSSILSPLYQSERGLLILGRPGSGKTVVLLRLAKALLEKAKIDLNAQVPLVLELQSWHPGLNFLDWLIKEIDSIYGFPERYSKPWIESDRFILLLDGLDDVFFEYRDSCIKSIIEFQKMSPVVICCRIEAYDSLITKPNHYDLFEILPPSVNQIEDYFSKSTIGEKTKIIELVKTNSEFQELAQSLFNLKIISLVFDQVDENDMPEKSVEDYQSVFYEQYISHVFSDVSISENQNSPVTSKYWLSWLAKAMEIHGRSSFLVSTLQPNWLGEKFRIWLYFLFSRALIGLLTVLVFGIFTIIGFDFDYLRYGGLSSLRGLVVLSLVIGAVDIAAIYRKTNAKKFNLNSSTFYKWLVFDSAAFAFIGPLLLTPYGKWIDIVSWWGVGMFVSIVNSIRLSRYGQGIAIQQKYFWQMLNVVSLLPVSWLISQDIFFDGAFFFLGVPFTLLLGMRNINKEIDEDIRAIGALSLSPVNALKGLFTNFFKGIPIAWALSFFFLYLDVGEPEYRFATEVTLEILQLPEQYSNLVLIASGLIVSFMMAILLGGLVGGFLGLVVKDEIRSTDMPNLNMRFLLRNTIVITIGYSVIIGYLFGFAANTSDPKLALAIALYISILGGLWHGGIDITYHYFLRLLLWTQKCLPFKYEEFLDMMVKLRILNKISAGYSFIHPSMMEYFSKLNMPISIKRNESRLPISQSVK